MFSTSWVSLAAASSIVLKQTVYLKVGGVGGGFQITAIAPAGINVAKQVIRLPVLINNFRIASWKQTT